MSFTIEADASEETAKAIEEGLASFNRKATGLALEAVPLNLAVRDAEGKLCGGIVGRTSIDTLYFSVVWMEESMRGHGVGRAMMTEAEEEGRRRGARVAWLTTLSWQARPFYEKLGYRVFGDMPVMDGRHTRYLMRKDL